ncbi:MAGE family-domain-containing protein [Globomyces pollinis-pini]|nr:MAGE family-domain-containing protein [Globomyces pollinis-pini]
MASEDSDDYPEPATQSRTSRHASNMDPSDVERCVNNIVRLAIYSEQKRQSLSREDIVKKAIPDHSRAFDWLLQQAQTRLKHIFGMELVLADSKRPKKSNSSTSSQAKLSKNYILRSTLPSTERMGYISWNEEESKLMNLLTVILSIIYSYGHSITHDSLKIYLNRLNIDLDGKSEIFGEMPVVMKTFLRQGYLDSTNGNEDNEIYYYWGPRSKVLYTEEDMIDFIVQMYPDLTVGKKNSLAEAIQKAANSN